jgi:hypothetical protein
MSFPMNQEFGIPRYKVIKFNMLIGFIRVCQTVVASVCEIFGIGCSGPGKRTNKLNKYMRLFSGMVVAKG